MAAAIDQLEILAKQEQPQEPELGNASGGKRQDIAPKI